MPELALTTTFSGDETIYTLGEDLAVDSPIVKKWYIVVSNTMSMEDMHASMVRAAKLLNVAHLASADYNTVQHQIWSVLSDYQVAVNDTDLAMGTFGQKCGDVLESLQEALICLADGEVEDAISAIKDCADYADKLSEQAQAIADTFSHLAENSKTAVGAAQTATALDKKRIKEADAAIKKTEADYAELRSLTYSYDTKKAEVQALYEDALSRAETAETRAFISSLVGGICSAVGQGLSAYAAARTPTLNIEGLGSIAPTQGAEHIEETSPPEQEDDQEEARPTNEIGVIDAGSKEEFEAAEENVEVDVEGEVGAGEDDGMKDAEDDEDEVQDEDKDEGRDKDKNEGQGEDEDEDEVDEAEVQPTPKVTSAPQKITDQEMNARLKGIAASANAVTARADKMANGATEVATALRKQVSELLTLRFAIEEKKAQALAKMASYAVLLQDEVEQVSTIEISVASLAQAIGAMQAVAAIFTDAATFWRGMKVACENQGKSAKFVRKIEHLADDDRDALNRHIHSKFFLRAGVDYCAGWTALAAITADYRGKMGRLGAEVSNYVAAHPSESIARKEATQLAADLGIDVQKAKEAAENRAKRAAAANKVLQAKKFDPNQPTVVN